MWSKLRPQDLIAALTICVCGTLLGLGRDGTIAVTLLCVVTGYYGIDVTPLGDILRRKNKKGEK